MAGIRRLRPDEFDEDGFPAFDVAIEKHGNAWVAFCPKLPGYWGGKATRKDAMEALEKDFAKAPVCLVPRVKFDDKGATRRILEYLRDHGASEAPSEALKPRVGKGEKPLGFSQSDLFQMRNQWREAETQLGFKIPMTDMTIAFAALHSSGASLFHPALTRHIRARKRIMEFLAGKKVGIE